MQNHEINSMDDFMNKIDETIKHLRKGDILTGKVLSVNDKEAIVSVGYMSDGIIPATEISYEKDVNPSEILKVDDEIKVYVMDMNDGEGNILLSKKRADSILVWDELKDLMEKKESINIKCEEAVKGGIRTQFKGLRVFMPASQISTSFVKDLNEYVGKELEARVIEVSKEERKVVVSAREIEKEKEEVKKEALWNELKVGEERTGKVRKLTKFGAFVDLGGVDGLIHLSELSWSKIKDASEVVNVGDEVKVIILELDKEKNRIGLGYKDKGENPWNKTLEKYTIGTVTEGTVVRLLEFGAFVELESNVQGLVHKSQISEEIISKPSSVLAVGDKVTVKVINIDQDGKKIALSIKEAVEKPKEDYSAYMDNSNVSNTLGDLFKDKLKDLL